MNFSYYKWGIYILFYENNANFFLLSRSVFHFRNPPGAKWIIASRDKHGSADLFASMEIFTDAQINLQNYKKTPHICLHNMLATE